MSDAPWSDVGAGCQSAVLHFRNKARAVSRPGLSPHPQARPYLTSPTSLKPLPSTTISMMTPGTSPAWSNSWAPEAPS
jgi:hypothetical protein